MTASLIDDVTVARRRFHLASAAAVLITALAALAFSGLMLVLVLGINRAQAGIADCTRPGGMCYERGQQNTRVAKINGRNIIRICEQVRAKCEQMPTPTP